MATSPVPDMAAPPGMCPGVAVMGGGGAGGDGDGSGSGGDGSGGGGADGSGANGNGDGKGGAGCGKGGASGCPNCGHKVAGGDPVDLATGEMFTTPHADLRSPGFIEVVFMRRYTTLRAARDVGIGYGWTHSFAWRFERKHRSILIEKGGGAKDLAIAVPVAGASTRLGDWTLSTAGDEYVLVTGDHFSHIFTPLASRSDRYVLRRVEHISGRGFDLEHDVAGRLAKIIDSAGRKVIVDSTREGRVGALSITEPRTGHTIVFARYEYDERGDLVRFTDADGFVHTYAYDDGHRMIRQTYPDGPTFHYVYDQEGRCIESWGETPDAPDPALATDLPLTLEDGRTRAKGFAHIRLEFGDRGYVEYSDSRRFWRLFVDERGNITKAVVGTSVTEHAFDERGNVASRTDPTGATSTYKHDARGQLVEETDPLGHTVHVERDDRGLVIANYDDRGRVQAIRDELGNVVAVVNQRNATTTYDLDARSMIVARTDAIGGVTRYVADDMGNLRALVQPNGATWHFDYDFFGRLVRRTDPAGRNAQYTYSPGGLGLRAQHGDLVFEYSYNGMGCVTEVRAPEGIWQIRWGGFRWPYERVDPNGNRMRAQYNREGWVVRHFNAADEVHSFDYDSSGMLTGWARFDGSRVETKYDAAHRRRGISLATGDAATITRDIVGRITRVDYTDGRTVEMTHDDFAASPSRVVTPEGTFRFEYDEVGNVVAEYQEIDGLTHWVAAKYDLGDHLIGLSTSLGHTVQFLRDPMGERRAVLFDDRTMVAYERDQIGLEKAVQLAGGARIETEYDERYRIVRRRLRCATAAVTTNREEPEWVGPRDADVVLERTYRYSATSQLLEAADRDKGTTTYAYDARLRLVAKVPPIGMAERFASDGTHNLYEQGEDAAEREYGRGNLLLRRGKVSYAYDANDRLVEKREALDDGLTRIWRFAWNAENNLIRVDTPDGIEVSFTYDPFARRTKKVIGCKSEDGRYKQVKQVRYVWFGSSILHEITTTADGARAVRTYAHTDRRVQPWAHRDQGPNDATPGEWTYYVGDILNTPEVLVRGDGRIVGQLERRAFGTTRAMPGSSVTTAIRFPGQYADEETGLHYNLHRYYDPETGRYICADPLGLSAGENHFLYAGGDPIGYCDETGLDTGHAATCELDVNADCPQKGTWVPHSEGSNSPQNPAPGHLTSGHTDDKVVHDIPGAKNTKSGETINTKGELGKTGNTTQPTAHTEQHATEWAKANFPDKDGKKPLEKSHMKLGGALPPCQICNDKMHKFAKDNNATVDYSYPQGNKLQYNGASGPNAVEGKDNPLTTNLANAYEGRNAYTDAGQKVPKGKSGYSEYMKAKGTW